MATTTSLSATRNPYLDGLLYGLKWSGQLSFGFPDSAAEYEPGYGNGEVRDGFAPVSAATQAAVRAALLGTAGSGGVLQGLGVAQFTNLSIVEAGTGMADLRIAQSDAPPTAYAYCPAAGAGGDVWFGTAYDYRNPVLGNYGYLSTLHELGHTLGLKHAQEAGGVANTAVPGDRDSLEFTVMTYRSYAGGPTSGYTFGTWDAPQGYMMLDIAALQAMYGADYTSHAGDNVYSWRPETGETFIDGIGQGAPGGNRIFLTLWDGGGHDTYDLSAYADGVAVSLAAGGWSSLSAAQTAQLGGSQAARGNVFNALLYQGNTASLIEDAIGGAGDDTLSGNEIGNHLRGGAGNDSLAGLEGNDTLEGGAGRNTLEGGAGNDLYILAGSGDVVTEFGNAGIDTVEIAGSYALGANLETLRLTGDGDFTGIGNALANALTGNAGNNSLSGGAGEDTLAGGEGADRLEGGTGLDRLSGGGGDDSLDGGAGHDSLDGGDGADTLAGGTGNDTMAGGPGDDTYMVDSSGDVLREAADAGTDLVLAGVSWTLGAWFEDLALTGDGNLIGSGNAADNLLRGNGGNNLLRGGAGQDTLLGSAGQDTLLGGAGQDAFRFMAADAGADVILDFNAVEDRFEFSAAGFGGGLAAGMSLGAERLVFGAAAIGALGQFLFDTAAHALLWDADGGGGEDAVLLATLYAPAGAVSAADFAIIA
ncbi:M10 family metallopeptidase [Siccirubricoccus phaeus]|uniref:M10 family metallopeptidase n=1 Tax=Siccirubricoccus phaeus TaxID=2595053 RepID=UPI0011F26D89|nr:M10 family metallopeptidase [Siccirubricoccus phaeus]